MNILDTIIAQKRKEVEAARKKTVQEERLHLHLQSRKPLSLKAHLMNDAQSGIIAEFKRRSPSKGAINLQADLMSVTGAYVQHGASGLSVLTDHDFFGGSMEDLRAASAQSLPLLRKDFIIDPLQIDEAKRGGADVILLIAACLSPAEVQSLATYAKSISLEVLLELHEEAELGHICAQVDMVGINNRNLKTFEVDIERSLRMAALLPDDMVKVAESGIRTVDEIMLFRDHGFRGFLIGEQFMKQPDPGAAFADFMKTYQQRLCV